uniref:phosphoserine phosphatase n=1 Tax=Polytomella parva TaxID=51329 RepID=A0A7S0V9Q1_9CHLO
MLVSTVPLNCAFHKTKKAVIRLPALTRGAKMLATKTAITTQATKETIEKLKFADAFCFDVDSTFCEDESIDELAAYLGVGEQVAALTAKAMGGTVEFKDALTTRLGVMKPTKSDIEKFLKEHPHRITKNIPELVSLLRSRGQKVFLVSGGFRQIIHPLADLLDIPREQVFANNILFNENGDYAGFDDKEFTCRSGGKPAAIRHIKSAFSLKKVVMVGDGATDLEARLEGAAELFIGYGGVVVRPKIAEKADWYVMQIADIIEQLKD